MLFDEEAVKKLCELLAPMETIKEISFAVRTFFLIPQRYRLYNYDPGEK